MCKREGRRGCEVRGDGDEGPLGGGCVSRRLACPAPHPSPRSAQFGQQSCYVAKTPSSLSSLSACLRPRPVYTPPNAAPHRLPASLPHSGECDAKKPLLSIKPEGECWSEGMIAGKNTEGSVETCQRKEERKAGRKERKVDRVGKQSSWVQRTLSEAPASQARVTGLILQAAGQGIVVRNHRRAINPRRNDARDLPVRSGASLPFLLFLVWWMFPVRCRGQGSPPASNKRGMCCCSSKAYGVEESQHHCPLAHTSRQDNDPNNNLRTCKLARKSEELDKEQVKAVSWASTVIQRLRGGIGRWAQRRRKRCRLNSFSVFKRRLHLTTLALEKSFYKKLKYSGTRHTEDWRTVDAAEPGTVEGIGKAVLWVRGEKGGQQRRDKTPDNHERHWWAVNGSNGESGDDPARHAKNCNSNHDAATTRPGHNRSFDLLSSGRKKLSKGNEGLRRSVSTDQSKSDDDTFFNFIKYRDKALPRRAKIISSTSSEDPAADLKLVLRTRPSKSSDRKRSTTGRRTEAAHKRPGGEPNRSRRRQAKKIERSPSSRSSSSSRSASATRARTPGGLSIVSAYRLKRDRSPDETKETSLPVEDNCKDDTEEFLRKLDSVLTDLVESEKRKISSFGQPSVQNSKEEGILLTRTSKKKSHKHKHKKTSKDKDRLPIEKEKEEASPALQQLRATLKTVRVRKRPTPPTADIMDTYSQCFTQKQPHNPRILRSQQGSQLLSYRCYQPPRRRQPRSHPQDKDYQSDFCSSDEEKPTVEQASQDVAQKKVLDDTDRDDQREHARSSHQEEDDIYGCDYQVSQGLPARRPANSPSHVTQRLVDAADSGDHSVDSAYTGSRGATPESILYPSVKPRRKGTSLNTPSTGARPRPSGLAGCSPKAERLQQLKRNILNEIREGGLYSDESINSLLDQYRRRYSQFSSPEIALVTRSIQDDLGVKPRPAEYLYQILIASEDDHSPSAANSTTAALATTSALLMKAPPPVKLHTLLLQRQDVRERQTSSPLPPAPTHPSNEGASRLAQEEADEAWAKSVLGEVAPALVLEAKEEARHRPQHDGDPECSTYVADLCQQLQLKL